MKYRNIIRYASVLGSTLGAIGAASAAVNDYNEFVLPLVVVSFIGSLVFGINERSRIKNNLGKLEIKIGSDFSKFN
ncbi:MAG: hypothetical protein ABIH37_02560 [archaeon]